MVVFSLPYPISAAQGIWSVFSLPYPISAAPAGVALPPGAAGRTLHEEHEALRLLAPVVRRSCWTPISMLTRCERCKQKGQMSAPNNSNNYILRYHFDPSPIALSLFFHDLLASYAIGYPVGLAPSPQAGVHSAFW